jgi:hypothetical protein
MLASVVRMEKRRWAKEKQQKIDHQRQMIASDDPMGFKAYEAARAHLTHEQRMEQVYEDIGRRALGGLVQDAFDALGIAFVVHPRPDGSLGYEARTSWEDQLGILDDIRRDKHHPFWS